MTTSELLGTALLQSLILFGSAGCASRHVMSTQEEQVRRVEYNRAIANWVESYEAYMDHYKQMALRVNAVVHTYKSATVTLAELAQDDATIKVLDVQNLKALAEVSRDADKWGNLSADLHNATQRLVRAVKHLPPRNQQ